MVVMRRWAAVVGAGMLCASVARGEITYRVRDLGERSVANATDPQGNTVGGVAPGGPRVAAVFPVTGGVVTLGTLGGPSSTATAINNRGAVTGFSDVSVNAEHAFLDTGTGLTDLGTLGGPTSAGLGINDAFVVVGWAQDASGTQRGFVFTGTLQEVSPLARTANGINNAGQIVGQTLTGQPYVLANGVLTNLPLLPGAIGGEATAINQAGWIVGRVDFPGGTAKAVLWRNGQVVDLNIPAVSSGALALNDAGQIVGFAFAAGTLGTPAFAFVWDPVNGARNLNDLIDPQSGVFLETGTGINDRGQITTSGTLGEASVVANRGFVLTPVPEVETGLALLVGVGLLIMRRR